MSSSTTYRDIQISLSANSVPSSSFPWPWKGLKSKTDFVRSVCVLEKAVQIRTGLGWFERFRTIQCIE